MSAPGGRRDVQASVGCWSILVISVVIRERTSRSPAWGSASGDAAACCEDGFLAAATVPAAMLIKNRFHDLAAQRTWCPVTAVPVITSVTSLGSTFAGLPGLLAHRLARTYSFGRTGHRIVSRRMAYHRPDGCSATARHCAAMPSRATRPGRFPAAPQRQLTQVAGPHEHRRMPIEQFGLSILLRGPFLPCSRSRPGRQDVELAECLQHLGNRHSWRRGSP
jgi:hypothetical protein